MKPPAQGLSLYHVFMYLKHMLVMVIGAMSQSLAVWHGQILSLCESLSLMPLGGRVPLMGSLRSPVPRALCSWDKL